MGKKGKKGPVMPPGMTEEYFMCCFVLLAESKTDQTRWHATATLLNLAAHGTRVGKLEAAGAPPYITNLPPNRVFEGVSPTSKPRPPTSMGDIPRPGTAGPDAP
ncbi:hypothetical protein PPROV_000769400 [Pycnococcus provasolii]|uniref:Uncharacterized protein n=1 Tax=Pycnococcus provasolii TaxID=41880 RepID=A0A830HVL6_9CHLO|nr:hypothetical protein PPROV_000769400 [Pycnococcus provasolii]